MKSEEIFKIKDKSKREKRLFRVKDMSRHKFTQTKREEIILAYKKLRREKTFYHERTQSTQRRDFQG
jgi:hypothetical protein